MKRFSSFVPDKNKVQVQLLVGRLESLLLIVIQSWCASPQMEREISWLSSRSIDSLLVVGGGSSVFADNENG